jgi:hypothetical protein
VGGSVGGGPGSVDAPAAPPAPVGESLALSSQELSNDSDAASTGAMVENRMIN